MKLPFGHGLVGFEKKLSYKKGTLTRNGIALAVFFFLVLIPSMFVALPAFQAIATGSTFVEVVTASGIWASFWQSLGLSYVLAAIVTVLGIALGLPMAILISRKTFGNWPSIILDTLINVPIIVPSIALGCFLKVLLVKPSRYSRVSTLDLCSLSHHLPLLRALNVRCNGTHKHRNGRSIQNLRRQTPSSFPHNRLAHHKILYPLRRNHRLHT